MFFRYPGGKRKLNNILQLNLYDSKIVEYREPFFGSGSVGLSYLEKFNPFFSNLKRMWINDKDKSIYSLWMAIKYNHTDLKTKIMEYSPVVDDFYVFKDDLLNLTNELDFVDIGFKKIVIHQISYSGLGTKSGGPLGGKKQESKYKIDCRWSPVYICKKIDYINSLFKKVDFKCTSFDFSVLLENINDDMLIYLDPPYYIKGNELYQEYFSIDDHKRLSNYLKNIKCKWIISYDYCDEISSLYEWANIKKIDVLYSIKGVNKKNEVIISNGEIKGL